MITNPIIPIPLMVIISLVLLIISITSKNIIKIILRLLIISLLFVINLRPMLNDGVTKVKRSNLDVIFVLDTTLSMEARDMSGDTTRLSQAIEDVEYITGKYPGAYFSIITFDNAGKIKLPFTPDVSMVENTLLSLVSPAELYARGTNLNECHDVLLTMSKRRRDKNNRITALYFLTDGEITSEEELSSFKDISEYIDGGSVLGYGTEQGGKMYVKDTYTEEYEVLQDTSVYPHQDAISKIDEDNLKDLASDLGIDYIHMTKQSNIDKNITSMSKKITYGEENDVKSYRDIYYYFSIPLIILLIIEFSLMKRRLL